MHKHVRERAREREREIKVEIGNTSYIYLVYLECKKQLLTHLEAGV